MTCYESDKTIQTFDLLVAVDSEFNLTRNKVYVALSPSNASLVVVKNDLDQKEYYSTENFKFYNGETIGF